MTLELQILAATGLLWALQLCLLAVAANLQLGPRYLMGPRDEPRRLEGLAGRLQRAQTNLTESLLLFTVAVAVLALGGAESTPLTRACALVYLGARLGYLPAYAFGLSPWRSLIWAVGFLATLVLLLVALAGL